MNEYYKKYAYIVFNYQKEFLELQFESVSKEIFELTHKRLINAYVVDGNIGVGKSSLIKELLNQGQNFAMATEPVKIWQNFGVVFHGEQDVMVDLFSMFYYTMKNFDVPCSEELRDVLKEIIPTFQKIILGTKLLEIIKVCDDNPTHKNFIFERYIHTDMLFSVLTSKYWDWGDRDRHTSHESVRKNSISQFYQIQNHFSIYLKDNFKSTNYIFLHCDLDGQNNAEFVKKHEKTFKLVGGETECANFYMNRVLKRNRAGENNITVEYLEELNRRYSVFIHKFREDSGNKIVIVNPLIPLEENAKMIKESLGWTGKS